MKTTLAIIALVALVFAGCNAIENRINDPKDIAEAEKVSNGFIDEIKARNYDKAMERTQLSPSSPDYDAHITLFKDLNEKLGDITSYKLDTATATVAEEGSSIEGVFHLKYTVDYQRGKAKQNYTMQYNDGKIIVMSYIIETE